MDVFDEERQPFRGEFMPLSIVRAVWKQKYLILASWAAILLLGSLVIFNLAEIYQARTVILIEHQRIPERYVTSTVSEDLSSRLNRISQEILSFEPLLRLIEEFDLYAGERQSMAQEEIVAMMRGNIDVEAVDGWAKSDAPAFQITFEGKDPNVVAQVANRLARLFMNENLRTRSNQALQTSEFLTRQLEERRRDVERQEEVLRDFRARHMGELPEQQGVLLGELRRHEAELDRIDAQELTAQRSKIMYESSLATAQSTLEMLKRLEEQRQKADEASGKLDPSNPTDPTRSLRSELKQAEAKLVDIKARYSEQHPDYRTQVGVVAQLEAMLDEAKAAAEASREESQGETIKGPYDLALSADPVVGQSVMREVERVEKLRVELELVQQELQQFEQRRQETLGEIAALEAKLDRIPIHEQELKKVIRDYDISNQNYRQLLDKRLEAELASEMENGQKAERFTQLEAARVPETPIRPNRLILLAGVAGGGLFAGCLLGFGLELRRNVILGEWELPPDVALLGQVPFIEIQDVPESAGGDPQAQSSQKFQRRAIIASTLALSLLVAAATSIYFGWISF